MSNLTQATTAPWRIGVLFSRTGFMSVIEETQYQGTQLAIEEVNEGGGVCGRELVPVAYDPGSDSAAYGHYAKRLMVEDQVSTIIRLLHLVEPQGGAAGGRTAKWPALVPDAL
ncbi:transporter substrate-binding protein [Bradyrhizobium quebecense]|uniref:transporter substrate-binding protein n=1 Tax=Bradyrhizobium quebecense TaxID=2748629 RepID=UPI003B836438